MTTVVTDVDILLNTVVERQVLTVGEAGPAGAGTASIADGRLFANISGGSAVPSGHTLTAVLDALAGSTSGMILRRGAAVWAAEQLGLTVASGKTLTVSKSMTITAADDTGVYTFPTGTASLARIDAAQTFDGVQRFNNSIGVGGANSSPTNYAVEVVSTNLSATSQYGIVSNFIGSSNATLNIVGFASVPNTAAAVFTSASVVGFRALNAVKGAGSTITALFGVRIDDQTQGTSNYGLHTSVSSGSGKFNIYSVGTAQSVHAGNFGIGAVTEPTSTLTVTGTGTFSGILSTTDATDATSATAASLKTAGGIAAVKSAWIGDKLTVAGVTSLAAGTVAAPSLYFGTDTGTGWYRSSANEWSFSTSGTQRLKLLSTGLYAYAAAFTLSNVTAVGHASFSIDAGVDKYPTLSFYENTALKWSIYNDYATDNLAFGTSGGAKATLSSVGAFNSVGILSTTDATDATSATAASLKTAGGGAFVKGIWVGQTSRLVGNVQMDGTLGIGAAAVANHAIRIASTLSGNVAQRGISSLPTFGSDATTSGIGNYTGPSTAAAAYTMVAGYGFYIDDWIKGAGSTITTQYGIYIANQTKGTTNYAIYSAGGQSVHSGNIRLGSTTPPTVALDVTGAALISTTLGVTGALTTNGGLQTFGANDSAGAGYRQVRVPNV